MTTPRIHIILAWLVPGWLHIHIGEWVVAASVAIPVGSPQGYPILLSMFLYLLSHLLHLVLISFSDLVASPLLALLDLHLSTSGQSLAHPVLHRVLHLDELLCDVAISEALLEFLHFLRLACGIRIFLILETIVGAASRAF